jgi:hypothetical protein
LGKRVAFYNLLTFSPNTNGHGKEVSQPTQLEKFLDIKIKKIKFGDTHAFVLTEEGQVYSWGAAYFCGHGVVNEKTPGVVTVHSTRYFREPKVLNLQLMLIFSKLKLCQLLKSLIFLQTENKQLL